MMTSRAWYNENDKYAAQYLRNLIAAGLIADGDVDDRSIVDVTPSDLKGYTQCHFFAGLGGWSCGLRLVGWPDDEPVWTGSCPCQGESVAGKMLGRDDPRHLWPAWFPLIKARRPAVVMGEQVARAAGTHWFDGVCADMEGINYATRAAIVPACAVDAPHRRDRLWFVSDAECRDGDRRGQASRSGDRKGELLLGGLVRAMWPTMRAAMTGDAHPNRLNDRNLNLEKAVSMALWSTASARDWKDSAGMATTGINPDGSTRIRLDQLPRQAAAFGATHGSDAQTEKPGALNPEFVCWLMGYPPAWVSCAPSAMPSSRKSRPKSSPPTCKCGYPATPCDKTRHDYGHDCVKGNEPQKGK